MGRGLAVLLGLVVLVAGLYGVRTVVSSRDDAGVASQDPADVEPDGGAAHGKAAGPVTGEPPTSGPHQPDLVGGDARVLSADQLLHALELGDVVLAYGGDRAPAELIALQEEVAGPFDAELAAAGQAIVLARSPGLEGVQALAWRRREKTADASDPALRAFAERWLGKGLAGAR